MKAPIAYRPDIEHRKPDEDETIGGLRDALGEILETTAETHDHAIRSVHAKAHGVLQARLTVLSDLPAEYAQGLFATPGTHQAIMRFSTNPGDILDDFIALPRGLAVKVLDVEGARLAGSEGESVQDFVMINAPVFSAPSAKAFLANLKLLAKTTDRAQWAKKGLSAAMRGAETLLETAGAQSATLQGLGGAPQTHPLGETYYTATPYRFGRFVAKIRVKPDSPSVAALAGRTVSALDRPDALREEILAVAGSNWMGWQVQVQLCRDPDAMPIEDPTVEWSEDLSPFVTVARLEAGPQVSFHPRITQDFDDRSRFSPWTGLKAHEPLGEINRARRGVYAMSAEFRERFNRCPIHQPRRLEDLPFPDKGGVRPTLPRRTMPDGPHRGREGIMDMPPGAMLALGLGAAVLGFVLYGTLSRRGDRG
ncbi:hypothetical protein OCGS_2822 [Oceaniovalibus guishaninsula JLT2003]|uniref:Catalase n=1 Tax=Oceaniovalibus guishaninsula JLT2003 TaxID=1231392 RepID=K2GKF9_9RHOB|nr:catalase family protein [Oceaniovalibus guishaninsula]EKE43231.1 hypothetical protein OCGS_2822 [Oceaniovalibus guishaninsula JLT2003]